jgi:hypothetical protein
MTDKNTLDAYATFDETGDHRLMLARIWDRKKPVLVWVMLNPSTADGMTDDPTIRRVVSFSKKFGYGGAYVANLYSYCATNSRQLVTVDVLEHDLNALALSMVQEDVVLAYGAQGTKLMKKKPSMLYYTLTQLTDINMYSLDVTNDGSPKHPLYVPAKVFMRPYEIEKKHETNVDTAAK